jgi:membrane associated rhomboid family serine protease
MATAQPGSDLPIWARDDAFPLAPAGWGWVNAKKHSFTCDSLEALSEAIRDDRDGSMALVWTPAQPRMILPEELPGMTTHLLTARERWTRDDLEDARRKLRWFALICVGFIAYSLCHGWLYVGRIAIKSGIQVSVSEKLKFASHSVLNSPQSGLVLLLFVIFAFIPWYQARKRRKELHNWDEAGVAAAVPSMRFETWLERQKAPLTMFLLAVVAAVGLAQLFCHARSSGWSSLLAIFHNWDGISEAGLVKEKYVHGEWWRLFTGPLLHGNIVHFLMNAAALAYLGKRLEVFARWPHLSIVFLFSAFVGGLTSVHFVTTSSVGASGGLMGWLGFLLVFETLHGNLVPLRARKRLAAGVFLTALIGLIGYRYIDNAAHAGGLIAGMLYAVIVFPKSSSANRPSSTNMDRIAGGACLLVILASAIFAILRILKV